MNQIPDLPNENPFSDEVTTFDSVDNFLDTLQEDLAEEGFEVEFGEEHENSVELLHNEGEEIDDLRVPTNLDIVNKQMGPFSGYDMLLDMLLGTLNFEDRDGDVPFLEI